MDFLVEGMVRMKSKKRTREAEFKINKLEKPTKWEKKERRRVRKKGINTGIPRERRVATAESRTDLRRPMIAIEAPCLPNWVEISKPIPEPPPVSKATLPFNTFSLKGDDDSISSFLSFEITHSL